MGRLIVAGSVNMDVVAHAARMPEPGETVQAQRLGLFPGGKGANQAVAAARLGARVLLCGTVGDDEFGARCTAFLADAGVDVSGVRVAAGTHTGTAQILIVDEQNAMAVADGANAQTSSADLAAVPIARDDVVVSVLEIPHPAVQVLFERAAAAGARVVFNAAPAGPCPDALLDLADVLVVNEWELRYLTGIGSGDLEPEREAALLRRRADQVVVVTLGGRGVVALTPGGALRVPGHRIDVADPTGAGDCFTGSLATELSRGVSVEGAIRFANAAAACAAEKYGASAMPDRVEVDAMRARAAGDPG